MERIISMKFLVQVFFLLVFNFSTSVALAQPNKTAAELEDYADSLSDNEKWQKAIPIYKKIVADQPGNGQVYNKIGLCYFYLENYQKAKENFRLAALYTENDETILSNVSAAYNNLNDFDNAFAYAIKAVKVKATGQTVLNAMGMANNLSRYEDAINIYQKAPEDVKNYRHLGVVLARTYMGLGEYDKSITIYKKYFNEFKPDKTVTVDIPQEKYNYFTAIVSLINERGSSKKHDPLEGFAYKDELQNVYTDLMQTRFIGETFMNFTRVAHKILLLNPAQKKYLKQTLDSYDYYSDWEKIEVYRLSGEYDKSIQWLDNNVKNKLKAENLLSAEMTKKLNAEKLLSLIFSYNDKLLLQNISDKKTQDEILEFVQKVWTDSIPKDKDIKDDNSSRMNAMACTIQLIKNILNRYPHGEQKDFCIKLLTKALPDYTAKDINQMIEKFQKTGEMN